MPPKTQFSKEHIITAAFEIASEEGLEGITIRKVAERLGSSIAPIYVNFASLEELIEAVVSRTFAAGQELLAQTDTGRPFFDLGVASLRFAREYSPLFRDLILKPNRYMQSYEQEMSPAMIEHLKKDPLLSGFDQQELADILLKMRIFQLGLSVMVANQLLPPEFDETKVIQLLNSAAENVIFSTRVHKK